MLLPYTMVNTYCDDSLAEAQRPPATIFPFILRLVVAQSIIFQHDPSVLPSMYVVCPLQTQTNCQLHHVINMPRNTFNFWGSLVMFTWCAIKTPSIEAGSTNTVPCLKRLQAPRSARIPGPHPHPNPMNSFRTFKSKLKRQRELDCIDHRNHLANRC